MNLSSPRLIPSRPAGGLSKVLRIVIAALVSLMAAGINLASARAEALSFTNYTTTNGLGNNRVRGVYASGSTVYAATDYGLSLSTNGGANWTNYTTTNGLGDNFVWNVYASGSTTDAATDNGLSISANGGANWTNYITTNGLGSAEVYGVFADANYVYAATNGGVSIAAINPVPEPSTYAMALAGLACGGFAMRRRRRRA
ncbi:MAG: PEP-CTERM sorting domain-containing protein [Planctomycetaceae bacterium]